MSKISYIRKIIEVEFRLGFLYVPAKGQPHLPQESTKITVHFSGEKEQMKQLLYNTDYNRIFGLTSWYKQNNIKTGDVLVVAIEDQEVRISSPKGLKKKITSSEEIKEDKGIDISNLSSGAKGNIVEDRVKELVLLLGQGLLNVYKPVIDNEGIDLIVLKSGQFHPLFLQVKSRYNALESQKLTLTISGNFKAHHSYFLIGVPFDSQSMQMGEKILCVPSKQVLEKAIVSSSGKLRIVASLKSNSKDQWQEFMLSKEQFIEVLFNKFALMEEHYK